LSCYSVIAVSDSMKKKHVKFGIKNPRKNCQRINVLKDEQSIRKNKFFSWYLRTVEFERN